MEVEKHFEDFHEDQFDFHSYCIRKVTLRSYVDVLRWSDALWGDDTYAKAAEGIIRTYIRLHDNPTIISNEVEPDYASMSAAARKTAKAQARKKKLKAEKAAAEKVKKAEEEAKDGKDNKSEKKVVKDEDPNGLELLKKVPLDEAKKYVATLVMNAPNRMSTWLCQYDVCSRRGKNMMALQALFRARALVDNAEGMSSEVFMRIVDFCQNVKLNEGTNAAIEQVFTSEKETLLGGSSKSLNDFVNEWHAQVKNDALTNLSLRTEVAKAMVSCKAGSASDASNVIVCNGLEIRGATLEGCEEAFSFLKSLDGAEGDAAKFASLAKELYPLSSKF